ncbi:MAG: LysR family transcriptional regulator [Scytonematopsis contorta HA4267-MV1]|nr:LysR family transcriptional regulator [Scytonematopsis contorta HA4267-MV1]
MKQATLYQLKVFEAAARHGSFSRAAEELFVSQPTVSMQVKQLSKSVGLPLFQQVGKRMHLTDAGRQLLGTCQEIFDTITQFETKVTDFKSLKQGELRLAATTTAKYLLPRTLGTFCQLYPGIDVRLQLINHKVMTDRMLGNLDDLYIMSQVPDNIDVITQPFLEDPLVVVASVNHPLAKEKNLSLQELIDESGFILREPGSETRRVVQKFLEEQQIKIKGKLEFGSNESIKHAIAGGFGISILSQHTLMSEPAVPGLTILDVEHLPLKRNWYIVHPTGKHLSITARTYLNYLLETESIVKPFVNNINKIDILGDFSRDKDSWTELAVSSY